MPVDKHLFPTPALSIRRQRKGVWPGTCRHRAREKGPAGRARQDERCVKKDVGDGQPDVRSRSAAAIVSKAHSAYATRTRGGPLLCRRRRCVTGFQALGE